VEILSQEKISYHLKRIDEHPVLSEIGNTPLIRMLPLEEGLEGVQIYAKAEFFNPGGSVKDRPALNMVRSGFEEGSPCKLSKSESCLM